jgi:hypothetical protein
MQRLDEVVGSLDQIMGVKARFWRSIAAVACFRTEAEAEKTAAKANKQPYLITIGASRGEASTRGRVYELMRVTNEWGDTNDLVAEALFARLDWWRYSVKLSEVYRVEGEPRLIEDLRLQDRILPSAFDRVVRPLTHMTLLWDRVSAGPWRCEMI